MPPIRVGRPVKWDDPKKFQAAIDAYFAECDKSGEPKTIAGLALSVDLTMQGLSEYGDKELFSSIVKRAKQRVIADVEKRLFGSNPTGAIFWLKNHGGYKDKVEQEHSGGMTVTKITINPVSGTDNR